MVKAPGGCPIAPGSSAASCPRALAHAGFPHFSPGLARPALQPGTPGWLQGRRSPPGVPTPRTRPRIARSPRPTGTKPPRRSPTCVPLVVADEPPGEEPHHQRCGQVQTATLAALRRPAPPRAAPHRPHGRPPHLSCPRRCPPPPRS